MSQEQQPFAPEEAEPSQSGAGQQQQQPQQGHAGHGSDSIIKQLREWERRRASEMGGKRRQGPGN